MLFKYSWPVKALNTSHIHPFTHIHIQNLSCTVQLETVNKNTLILKIAKIFEVVLQTLSVIETLFSYLHITRHDVGGHMTSYLYQALPRGTQLFLNRIIISNVQHFSNILEIVFIFRKTNQIPVIVRFHWCQVWVVSHDSQRLAKDTAGVRTVLAVAH